MESWLRRLRGALGMDLTWRVGCSTRDEANRLHGHPPATSTSRIRKPYSYAA
jgi:hypothetical protein